MRIKHVSIKNFRSLVDVKFNCGPYSIIVGENNSGKSNIVAALNAFFDSRYRIKNGNDVPKIEHDNDNYEIEINFILQDEEKKLLPEYYQFDDNQLVLNRNMKTGKIYAVKRNGELFEKEFIAETNISINTLPYIVFIPAISKIDDELKLTGPSAFRDLIQDMIKDIFSSDEPHVQALKKAFVDFQQGIKVIPDDSGYSIERIVEDINHELEGWNTSCDVEIEPIDADRLIKNLTTLTFKDMLLETDGNINTGNIGSGLQRHIIYTLIRLNANMKRKKNTSDKKRFLSNSTIILFEEPEAYLHPPYQDILAQSLKELASDDNYQVILTTHSTRFISNSIDDIPNLVKTCRKERMTSVLQLSESAKDKIFTDNTKINSILEATKEDDTMEMEMVKHFLWLDNYRNELFFAKNVLLVEGPTETNLIRYMIYNNIIQQPKNGLTIIDTMGKYNTHRFMSLMNAYNINHVAIIDVDKVGSDPYKVNQIIEDSKGENTLYVEYIDPDIETLLGIRRGRSDKKPQWALYDVITERISLDPLVGILNKCIEKFP